jgi:shikimate kinase
MNDIIKKRILLIGFRGCGKSTIGKELAHLLEWKYVSTDGLIEEREEMRINEIVEKSGWAYFRKLEAEVISGMQGLQNCVIDTGAGTAIKHSEEIQKLRNSALVVWIDASLPDVIARLNTDRSRPLLNQKDLIEDVRYNYEKRKPVYEKLATHRFNTSAESVEEICNEIISEMRKK